MSCVVALARAVDRPSQATRRASRARRQQAFARRHRADARAGLGRSGQGFLGMNSRFTSFDLLGARQLNRRFSAWRRVAALLRLWAKRMRSRRELTNLDDVHLADVGISRSDADEESRKP